MERIKLSTGLTCIHYRRENGRTQILVEKTESIWQKINRKLRKFYWTFT